MMAGNPNWWSMNSMHPQFVFGSNPNSLSSNPCESDTHNNQDFPARSWSQLLLAGLAVNEEENRLGCDVFEQRRKLQENGYPDLPKQDYDLDYHEGNRSSQPSNTWPHPLMPVSSCTTNLISHSLLNFYNQENSSECNSSGTGGVPKKARVQQSSPQPALKVRKEKLGDRITSLHQIFSPFGKTDTASVLSEAIRQIRFLQAQIEALSGPYMCNSSGQHSVQQRNSFFREERGQLINKQDSNGARRVVKDLRSRGLCLVPISYTQHVGNDKYGVDYWAPPPALG